MARKGNSRRDQINFNGGEISPLLYRRYDLDVFGRGCRQLQNMIPRKYGNSEKRVGTQFIASTKYGATRKSRLITFSYSTNVVFFLEFGHLYIRFFTDGGAVMNGASVYEIASPYDEDAIFDIDWKEINDVIYITHPLISPRKLARYGNTNWTLTEIVFDEPAFMDLNATSITLTPSVMGGVGTLTASAPLFNSGHVGSWWKLGMKSQSKRERSAITSNGEKPFIRVKGKFTFRTCGTWAATITLQRKQPAEDESASWEDVYTYEAAKDQNFDTQLEQENEIALWRVKVSNFTSYEGDTPYATLEAAEDYIYGIAQITAVTSSTVATINITDALYEAGTATDVWYEGAWSTYRGFPRTCCLFQERMVYAGTAYEPQRVWGSVIGDYENFAYGTNDDDAFSHQIGADERLYVMWATAHNNSLLIGTSSAEYVMCGSNAGDDPVTPRNVQIKRQCSIGSARMRPIQAGGAVLHVQRDTEKLYELTYSISTYGYDDNDITQFSEHIMKGGVKAMAFQRQPDPIVWIVRNDGVLLSCIYDASQKVVAWARHVTQGTIEDVTVGYGTTSGDEVWVIVKRTLGDGSEGRYVERIYPGKWETKDEAWYVDSALSNTAYAYNDIAVPPSGGGGTGTHDEQDDGGGNPNNPDDPYYPSEPPDPENPWIPEDPAEKSAPCPSTQCRYKAVNPTLVGFSENAGYVSVPPKKYRTATASGSVRMGYPAGGFFTVGWSGSSHVGDNGTVDSLLTYNMTSWDGSVTTSQYERMCTRGPGNSCQAWYAFDTSATTRYLAGRDWHSLGDIGCSVNASLDNGVSAWTCDGDHQYSSSGTANEMLSDEDTESDAEARALAGSVTWVGPDSDSCQVASFRTDRGATFSWSATQVQHRAQVPDYDANDPDREYEVDLWYVVTEGLMSARWITEVCQTVRKKPASAGDNWTDWVDIPIPDYGFFAWHMGCRVRVYQGS